MILRVFQQGEQLSSVKLVSVFQCRFPVFIFLYGDNADREEVTEFFLSLSRGCDDLYDERVIKTGVSILCCSAGWGIGVLSGDGQP